MVMSYLPLLFIVVTMPILVTLTVQVGMALSSLQAEGPVVSWKFVIIIGLMEPSKTVSCL